MAEIRTLASRTVIIRLCEPELLVQRAFRPSLLLPGGRHRLPCRGWEEESSHILESPRTSFWFGRAETGSTASHRERPHSWSDSLPGPRLLRIQRSRAGR